MSKNKIIKNVESGSNSGKKPVQFETQNGNRHLHISPIKDAETSK
jgi:hypothetical protein